MDGFMDKLATKLNAQEMIRANTAAETQELQHMLMSNLEEEKAKLQELKAQTEEYRKCLEELRQVNSALQENAALMEETLQKMREVRAENNVWSCRIDEQLARFEENQENQQAEQRGELLRQVRLSLERISGQINDFVHKENVKVYRNVQAVVLEESGKQEESVKREHEALSGKIGSILGVAVAALVLSVAGAALQVLIYFNII